MSGFYTGYKTDSGKDLIFLHKGDVDMVSVDSVNRRYNQVKTKPPFDGNFVKVVKGVPMFYQKFPVPCGKCIGCKMTQARQWSVRCALEQRMHDRSWFVTLTFAPEHYPKDVKELKPILQKFMKRLRFHYSDQEIRFFACCEKGENTERWHYHLILFGLRFNDLVFFKMHANHPYYRSQSLEKLWPFGHSMVGEAAADNISYVCRYVEKKQSDNPDPNEFIQMSRRPGIGKPWFDAHQEQLSRHWKVYGNFAHDGCQPPRYFDSLLEKVDPTLYQSIKNDRMLIGQFSEELYEHMYHISGEEKGFFRDARMMKDKKKRLFL